MTAGLLDHSAFAPMRRREFLRAGSVPLLGLGLPHLLAGRAETERVTRPRPRAKACIVLFMWGGPAQQDTLDMKPSAPEQYRGEFRPISTCVPGIQICEHLPKLARHMDKLALLRAMTHDNVHHTVSTSFLLTGRGLA